VHPRGHPKKIIFLFFIFIFLCASARTNIASAQIGIASAWMKKMFCFILFFCAYMRTEVASAQMQWNLCGQKSPPYGRGGKIK
jgi:hypothetical protein